MNEKQRSSKKKTQSQQNENQCSSKKCKWSAIEDDLLINSYGLSNGNITHLLRLFNNRTPKSITTRISYLKRNGKLI